MRVIRSVEALRKCIGEYRRKGKTIGFVPTMGYFHEGHLALARACKKENDICVVSIYVNPAQFNPKEDLSRYPRDFKRDSSLLRKENVDILYYPADNTIYPDGYLTYIDVQSISNVLCGAFRPGHFRGVATIVAKLLNIVQPRVMYLGQKDAQQVVVLKTMVRDLNIPVRIRVLPTVREPDGLAMSSRNVYLSAADRAQAPVLYTALSLAAQAVRKGESSAAKIESIVRSWIAQNSSGKIQYVSCVDAVTLTSHTKITGDSLIAAAVFFGTTRLIDNVIIRHKRKVKG